MAVHITAALNFFQLQLLELSQRWSCLGEDVSEPGTMLPHFHPQDYHPVNSSTIQDEFHMGFYMKTSIQGRISVCTALLKPAVHTQALFRPHSHLKPFFCR